MYSLDDSGKVLFDEEKGLLIIEGESGTTIQLQQQQHLMLKSLCEHAGKVVTYSNLFRASHDEIASELGDSRSVANSVQTKIHEIRKALEKAGVKDASQLLSTNRSIGGYEMRLPPCSRSPQSQNAGQYDKSSENSKSKPIDEQSGISIPRHEDMLTSAALFSGAEVNAYYTEIPNSPIPKDRIVRCRDAGDGRHLFEFQLSHLDYTPLFASIAFEFWENVDLKKYLTISGKSAFCFDVDNKDNVLEALTVEFKTGELCRVFRHVDLSMTEGINQISIPLTDIDMAPLSRVVEISFVVHPDTMRSPDGRISIGNLRIELGEANAIQS